jgi:epoxyqueuosine reductase
MDTYELRAAILDKARQEGASLAGIAAVEPLRSSPSHQVFPRLGDYGGVGTPPDVDPADELPAWPSGASSCLVAAIEHPSTAPELDWWDGRGTPGNRLLIELMKTMRPWLREELGIESHPSRYYIHHGGIFLKDAGVLAGLGCLGRNNLFVSPELGPRIRLRGLFLEAELPPTGPIEYDPCHDCHAPCLQVCPSEALPAEVEFPQDLQSLPLPARDGSYDRQRCNQQMERDMARAEAEGSQAVIKYCRRCEFACPVGKQASASS